MPWFSWHIFTHADWMFRFGATLRDGLLASPWIANAELGQADIILWRMPFNILFGWLGLDMNIAEKLFVLWPAAILPAVASYMLIKKFLDSSFAALIGSIVFSCNTFFFAINTQGHLLLTVGFAVALFAFYAFSDAIERNDWSKGLWAVVLLSLTGLFDLRSLYLTVLLCGLYTLYRLIPYRKLPLRLLIAMGIGTVAINAFWILPGLLSGDAFANEVLNRSLFGNSFWTLADAITLHHPFWNGSRPDWFVTSPIPLYFWVIPVAAVSGLIAQHKNSHVVFFGLLAILGVLLAKQVDQPFSNLYPWLFEHIPGFGAFREASKFYFFIALGYAVLIAALVQWLQQSWGGKAWRRYASYLLVALITGLFLWNIKPLASGEIATMHKPRDIPKDYLKLKDFLLSQPDHFRTYWIPRDSRWGIYTNQHPKLTGTYSIENLWKQYANADVSDSKKISPALNDFLRSVQSEKLLASAAVKYVIVPAQDIQNDDDFFKYYGQNRQDYIDLLDKTAYLRRIDIGTKEVVVYENKEYDPYIGANGSLIGLDGLSSIEGAHAFLKAQSSEATHFEIGESHIISNNVLKQVFVPYQLTASQNSNRLQLRDTFVSKSGTPAYLHKNLSDKILKYELSNRGIRFLARPLDDLVLNGKQMLFDKTPAPEVLADVALSEFNDIYLQIDDGIVAIDKNIKSQDIGNILDHRNLVLYRAGANMLPNGSFEEGLWNDRVGDCHRYDEDSRISMKPNKQYFVSGNTSLELEAARHHACTSQEFDVTPGEYLLQLHYQSPNAEQAGYFLEFDDPAGTTVSERLHIESLDQWRNRIRRITVPKGATSARLYVYAYESASNHKSIVRYDNISLSPLALIESIALPAENNTFQTIRAQLVPEKNIFEYISKDYDGANLITNPSFESGAWEDAVGDCYNYDNKANISMQLITSATNGSKSLELSASKHHACTKTAMSIKAWGSHIFKFDYQGDADATAGYYIQFNDAQQSVVSGRLDIDESGRWYSFGRKVQVPGGATRAQLYVYAFESGKAKPSVVRYDNFTFVRSPDFERAYYLTQELPNPEMKAPASINFVNANPGKKIIRINGATKNFMLNFSERFHKGWKLYARPVSQTGAACKPVHEFAPRQVYLTDRSSRTLECSGGGDGHTADEFSYWRQKPLFDDKHIQLNGYANGWSIDPSLIKKDFPRQYYHENTDGSVDFELVIYYVPQSYMYLGIVLSGISLMAVTGLLILLMRRNPVNQIYRIVR